jgi:hypothetical protein
MDQSIQPVQLPNRRWRRNPFLLASVIAVIFATSPALAHNGYISCAAPYTPKIFSISHSASGTHQHQLHGIVSQWIAEDTLWGTTWNSSGFWSAHAPGTHDGWVECF